MAVVTYVKRSPIHGRGLFARTRIGRGRYLGTYTGPSTSRNGRHVLWIIQEGGTFVGINGQNALRYLNHSKRPNAEFVGDRLYATRYIPKGGEITIDYGPDWADTN